MLTISDRVPLRHCEGTSRRDFLRIGTLGLAGLTLPDLLRARAAEPRLGDRAVVLLFLQGGPPQTETFDPKMSAPIEFRSATGEIPTALAGITFGSTFPRMARIADRLAVVRSYGSGNAGHEYDQVLSGGTRSTPRDRAAVVSSVYAKLAGTNHPVTGFPRNIVVLPEAVQDGLRPRSNFETGALPTLTSAANLGPQFEAFNPAGGAELRRSMTLRLPEDRFADRRYLLAAFDDLRRDLDAHGAMERVDRYQEQAFEVIRRGVTSAFDLSRENPRVVDAYDTSRLFRMDDWTRYVNMNRTSNLLGRQMLLARRLVEAGCGFVTVSDCGWDLHADGNSAGGMTAMQPLGRQVDHAVATFLDDLHDRGLSDRVLLIVTGEMGRTPRFNNRGGRDHWANLTPLVLAGGGLRMGQVIGQSDRHAAMPATEALGPGNLAATILHYLFDLGQLRLRPDLPRELANLIGARPVIGGLF
jgi:uncharacterized protein (DUF1501 family)